MITMFSLSRETRREARTQAGGGPWHTHTHGLWTCVKNILILAPAWVVYLLLKCLEWKDSHPVLWIEVTWYDFCGFLKEEQCTGIFSQSHRVIVQLLQRLTVWSPHKFLDDLICHFFLIFTHLWQFWQRSLKWQPAAGGWLCPLCVSMKVHTLCTA